MQCYGVLGACTLFVHIPAASTGRAGNSVRLHPTTRARLQRADQETRDRVFGEIRLLRQLKHTNILSMFDWWLDSKSSVLVFITVRPCGRAPRPSQPRPLTLRGCCAPAAPHEATPRSLPRLPRPCFWLHIRRPHAPPYLPLRPLQELFMDGSLRT